MTEDSSSEKKSEYQTVRYEFYQSDSYVTIVAWLAGVQAGELSVSVTSDHFLFTVEKPDSSKYRIEFDFAHPILADEKNQPVTKIGAKKVEIKVTKQACIPWSKLEKVSGASGEPQVAIAARTTSDANSSQTSNAAAKAGPPSYPSSSKKAANWDAFERQAKADEAEDKPQDEAALNALFQKIYADSDDNTKRAMMKSFVESNGTVLSTDWSKIGKKETKTKPPEGMEYRKWQP